MILLDEYFQDSVVNYGYEPTEEDRIRCQDLLDKVNAMFPDADLRSGHRTREKTLALIAAGYRAAIGGQHEQSNAVDLADPFNARDDWLDDAKLEAGELYREAPEDTNGWLHLQRVPPKSGHRTFKP